MPQVKSQSQAKVTAYLLLLVIIGITLASRDITHEGAVQVAGDSPKYLMNGVFLYDFFRDIPDSLPN